MEFSDVFKQTGGQCAYSPDGKLVAFVLVRPPPPPHPARYFLFFSILY